MVVIFVSRSLSMISEGSSCITISEYLAFEVNTVSLSINGLIGQSLRFSTQAHCIQICFHTGFHDSFTFLPLSEAPLKKYIESAHQQEGFLWSWLSSRPILKHCIPAFSMFWEKITRISMSRGLIKIRMSETVFCVYYLMFILPVSWVCASFRFFFSCQVALLCYLIPSCFSGSLD